MTKGVFIAVALLLLLCAGCSKKNNDNVVTKLPPSAAKLTFPAQNSACITDTLDADDQIQITFTWNTSANTAGYELIITNLSNNKIIIETTPSNQLTIPLDFNYSYSWYVVSTNNEVTATAQSAIWKFYLAGPGGCPVSLN